MGKGFRRELGLILAWVIFPLVPVVLADTYYHIINIELFTSQRSFGPDPRDWSWGKWVLMLGPLVGYSFLAGATLHAPDDGEPSRRRWSRFLGRRAVWMAIGPWWGFLFWVGVWLGIVYIDKLIPAAWKTDVQPPAWWHQPWVSGISEWMGFVVGWIFPVIFWGTLAYGWLWPAWAALRRAARLGRWGGAAYRGLVAALAFVGSLFGSFWAITSAWRSYFFDPTLMPLVALALGLVVLSGCTATITYGEVRRRELFHAMLVAWVLGLALMWRWWSRRRPGSR